MSKHKKAPRRTFVYTSGELVAAYLMCAVWGILTASWGALAVITLYFILIMALRLIQQTGWYDDRLAEGPAAQLSDDELASVVQRTKSREARHVR